ncbi:MAG: ABC transporter ATP-binding protein/permease [Bifidobacterium sp.]|nr:ABC transporter ATP-binding protein/permease [Bifidobacterium sp.]
MLQPDMARNAANQPNLLGRPSGGRHAFLHARHEPIRDVKGTVARLLRYLSTSRSVLLAVFITALIAAVVSIVGTRLNGYTVDAFISTGDIAGLGRIGIIMLGMYAVGAVATYLQNFFMVRISQRTSSRIRRDLFSKTQSLPVGFFDTHSSGDLMSRLTNDVDNITMMLSQSVVQLFAGVVGITGMLAAMLWLSPILTAIALLTTPAMFMSTKAIAARSQCFFTMQQNELGRLDGYIEEMVSGQKVVTAFAREDEVNRQFGAVNESLVYASARAQAISSIMGPVNNTINNLTYLIITVAGSMLLIKGLAGITVGVLFSFLLYMRNFTQPINNILNLFSTIQSAFASAERIFEIMDQHEETDAVGAKDMHGINGDIEMRDVEFSYTPGKPVLHGADISARRGQTVAIVGPTGAGKTTIISLLTRFYDIDGGRILIDGRDISTMTRASLRSSISVVLQDTFLFSDSVRDNIRYGRLDSSDAEVEEAARQSCAHDFIMQLPHGYDTILADNGGDLSQGQRQLLGIARAMIAHSSVLILDEATSSIDTATEQLIQNALLTLMKGKTSFVIAHRLSTIRNADSIIVLDRGRVVETGTHDELMARGGSYAQLYRSQFTAGVTM